MRTNVATPSTHRTHEGAVAKRLTDEQTLVRTVNACLLWEDTFYEDGTSVAARISTLVPKVAAEKVAALAVHARREMKLRHAPLWLVREMARGPVGHRKLVADTLATVIQRADELCEFVALYRKEEREPLSAQVKKGLAQAFTKFDAYQLAKYNRDGAYKLRDVLFLCHAKPKDATQAATWKLLVDGTLPAPDTWEVALSAGKDKKETFTRLLAEKNLGALALLRNLRNMKEAGVPDTIVRQALAEMKVERVLPFRFVAAARYAPHLEPELEQAMFHALTVFDQLPGKTAIVVDNSGSMYGTPISKRSELDRSDAACALAILVREVCENALVIGFGEQAAIIPARRGFALRDAIRRGPGGGTYTENAKQLADKEGYDRIIIITDEQSHQALTSPIGKGYVVNVASYQNGIGYGAWTHIDGWSESVLQYIQTTETSPA